MSEVSDFLVKFMQSRLGETITSGLVEALMRAAEEVFANAVQPNADAPAPRGRPRSVPAA
jgi:hypothetical protein